MSSTEIGLGQVGWRSWAGVDGEGDRGSARGAVIHVVLSLVFVFGCADRREVVVLDREPEESARDPVCQPAVTPCRGRNGLTRAVAAPGVPRAGHPGQPAGQGAIRRRAAPCGAARVRQESPGLVERPRAARRMQRCSARVASAGAGSDGRTAPLTGGGRPRSASPCGTTASSECSARPLLQARRLGPADPRGPRASRRRPGPDRGAGTVRAGGHATAGGGRRRRGSSRGAGGAAARANLGSQVGHHTPVFTAAPVVVKR